jgi:hypothetical protein
MAVSAFVSLVNCPAEGVKTASAEWSFSAEAFAKGGDRDEHIGGVLHSSPRMMISDMAVV